MLSSAAKSKSLVARPVPSPQKGPHPLSRFRFLFAVVIAISFNGEDNQRSFLVILHDLCPTREPL